MTQKSPYEIIEQQRVLVARLQGQLDQAKMQLDGMEKIFGALPSRRRSPPAGQVASGRQLDLGAQPSVGGRQVGAISMRWRTILNVLHQDNKPFSPTRVTEVVKQLEDRVMKPSEAKRMLEGYVEHGYVKKAGWGDFLVTDEAAQRFDFQGVDELEALFNAANIATDSREPNPILDDIPPADPIPRAPDAWGQQPSPRGEEE